MSNDLKFVDTNARDINLKIINEFEELLGEPLYPGDERRIFLQQLTPIIVGLKHNINDCAKQNLLRYSRNEKLDSIGEDIFFTKRLKAQKASCLCKCRLSKVQDIDIIIPANTRVSPDGNIYFYIRNDVIINAGELEAIGILEAQNTGPQYNGFIPGQIKLMVDLIPFVESIVNTEISSGGSNIESDEKYKERCRLSQETVSTAGPDDAYISFAKEAHPSVSDAKVISPSPGVVRVIILLENAVTPSEEILSKVLESCSRRDRRPLTDKVEVAACNEVEYDIELTYYLDKNFSSEESIYRKKIEGENLDLKNGAIRDYINWQQSLLGNSINPDELRYRIQDAATYSILSNNVDKKFTAVRKIDLISPNHIDIQNIEVGKVRNISVKYGGFRLMDLNNINLLDIQTSYMKKDPTTIAMCEVLTPIFRELAKESKLSFIYGRIDELDDKTLDELAWQFHVDFYSVDFPINVKRNLIKDAKKIHRLKGTPMGVEHLLSAIFGSAKLVEWFEYDGDPFMFKIKVDVENNINLLLDKLEESINSVKNTRSHLEKIEIYTVSKSNTYIGSTTIFGEKVTVLPWSPKDLLSKGSFNISIGNSGGVENITLYPKKEVI